MNRKNQENGHFSTGHLLHDLKGRSVRGGMVTIASQFANHGIQLLTIMILARVLVPADFGLVAMVGSITGFIAVFRDAGLSTATIQVDRLGHDQVSTLFWINAVFGVALASLIAAIGPLVAWFYGDARLVEVTMVLALPMLIGGLGIQHRAILTRQMRFLSLESIGLVANVVGAACGIVAALLGAGYWSLVFMPVAGATVSLYLVWITSGWVPGWPHRGVGVRSLLSFGANLTLGDVLIYCTRNLDNVLIGWAWGAGALGFYANAYKLLLLPIQQINGPVSKVAVPALSRLQYEPEKFRSFYCNGLRLIAFVGMPIVGFCAVAADDIILIVLGDKWDRCVPIFRALAPAAFLGTFNVATGWLFVPLGKTYERLLSILFGSFVAILGFCIGLKWGAIGVAWGFSVSLMAYRLPQILYAMKGTPISIMDFFVSIRQPFVASLVSSAVLIYFRKIIHILEYNLYIDFASQSIVYAFAYLIISIAIPEGRAIIKTILSFRYAINIHEQGSASGHPRG